MNTRYLRHAWSHHNVVHRSLVKVANRTLAKVPFGLKYGAGRWLRRGKPPYCYITPGAVVVQVGAPRDMLAAGRSRAMYFALLVGASGKVVVIEPDAKSAAEFRDVASHRGLDNVTVCALGAWDSPGHLRVYVNDSHPASSFTEGVRQYDPDRLAEYRAIDVEVDSVDNILARHGINRVDLVSITTNGAEDRILAGMNKTIAAGLPFISLARTGAVDSEHMAGLGYELAAHDDRGHSFRSRIRRAR